MPNTTFSKSSFFSLFFKKYVFNSTLLNLKYVLDSVIIAIIQGSNHWFMRTTLEKFLLIGWLILIGAIVVLIVIMHTHASESEVILLHNGMC